MRIPKVNLRIFGLIVALLILAYLIRMVVKNWHEVQHYEWHLKWGWLLASLILIGLTHNFMVFVWNLLLRSFGYSLEFKKLFVIWWLAAMGRYLPGKMWQLVGLAVLAEHEGVPAEVTTSTSILTQMLSIISGLLIAIPTVLVVKPDSLFVLLIAIFALLIAVYPPIFQRLVNFVGKRFRGIEIEVKLSVIKLLEIIGFYLLGWVAYGVGFNMFLHGIADIEITPLIIPIYAFSYVVGLISIFVPGGLGVREGLITLFLGKWISSGVASATAIAARIWMTLIEVIFFVAAIGMSRKTLRK